MSKEASLRWYHRNRTKILKRRRERSSQGLCKYCGKKAVKDLSGCQKCLGRMAKQRRKQWRKRVDEKVSLKWELINLKGGKCMDCGYKKHHTALEFDHVRGKKIDAVANLINHLVPWSKVIAEVNKCDLVCANCHAIRTYERIHR